MQSNDVKIDGGDTYGTLSLEVSRQRVESLWRQALSNKSSSRADLAAAKATRTKAEMEKQRIAAETLEVTRNTCHDIIKQAESQLVSARQADNDAQTKYKEAEQEMTRAETIRAEAESYRETLHKEADAYRDKVLAESQQETQRVLDEARSTTLQECSEIKRHVTYEVQCILAEVEAIRTAAQEELEAQKIYTETAILQSFARDIRSEVMNRVDDLLPEDGSLPTNGQIPETSESWDMVEAGVGSSNGHSQDNDGPSDQSSNDVRPKPQKKGR